MLVTIDLDDTLIPNHHLYASAIQELVDFAMKHYDVTEDEVQTEFNRLDKESFSETKLLNHHEEFPVTFRKTIQSLADNPLDEHLNHAEEIGRTPFLTEQEYCENGFLEHAETMLTAVGTRADETHIVTAGDETIQQRKINALELDEYVDNIHIVPIDTKSETISELVKTSTCTKPATYHIGNSASSDVEAALDAGVNAVYIPHGEWRPTNKNPANETIHEFQSLSEFVSEIDTVLTEK